jgi:hypothetical protein
MMMQLEDMTPQKAYLTLLHFAKGLCSVGSHSLESAKFILEHFIEIRKAIFTVEEVPEDAEEAVVADMIDARSRKKGRPRKAQIARITVEREKQRTGEEKIQTCLLCRESHPFESCPHRSKLDEIRTTNEKKLGTDTNGAVRSAWM